MLIKGWLISLCNVRKYTKCFAARRKGVCARILTFTQRCTHQAPRVRHDELLAGIILFEPGSDGLLAGVLERMARPRHQTC